MSNVLELTILKTSENMWDWYSLTRNPAISMKFIVDNLTKYRWDYQYLSQEIPIEIVSMYPELHWDYHKISSRATPDEIEKYKNIHWDWGVFSLRPDVVNRFLLNNIQNKWKFRIISGNNLGITKRDMNYTLTNNKDVPDPPLIPELEEKEETKEDRKIDVFNHINFII